MESIKRWNEVFGEGDYSFFFAPGRVNLIGEHIDYLGGYVLPCAISLGTYMAIKPNGLERHRFYSTSFDELGVIEVALDGHYEDLPDYWIKYPCAVMDIISEKCHLDYVGYDIYFDSDLPKGAGLSSSASIEMVTAVMINELYQLSLSMKELALLSQKAENDYLGVKSGIMDQYSIGLGKERHGLLLDCDKVEHRLVPIILDHYRIVMTNSNKKRELTDSKYNQRRKECDEVAEIMCPLYGVNHLCHLREDVLPHAKELLSATGYRRVRHAITENQRTQSAFKALASGKLKEFGELMEASHQSLKNDYEVTGKHLDTLFDIQLAFDGCIGSRMTGAGFGGCTVSLVREDRIPDFVHTVKREYEKSMRITPDFYVAKISNGARRIKKEEMIR